MKHFTHFIYKLSEYRWLYRSAQVAFWMLATSVAMGASFALFAHISDHGCVARIERNEFVPGLLGLEVHCSGFPYANAVAGTLGVFLNLTSLSIMCLVFNYVLAAAVITGSFQGTSGMLSIPILEVFTIPLLLLHLLALLYALHLMSRLTR